MKKKIGIINCFEVSKRCSGSGCFKAFNNKGDSFEKHGSEAELISFVHCNGCSENSVEQVASRAERMKELGVNTIHLSSCIRSKCPYYEEFIEALSKDFEVIGYTHGSVKRKKKNAE